MTRYVGVFGAALILAACTAPTESPARTPTPVPQPEPSASRTPSPSSSPTPLDAKYARASIAIIWDYQTKAYRADTCKSVREIGGDKVAIGVGLAWKRDYGDMPELANMDWVQAINDLSTFLTKTCRSR